MQCTYVCTYILNIWRTYVRPWYVGTPASISATHFIVIKLQHFLKSALFIYIYILYVCIDCNETMKFIIILTALSWVDGLSLFKLTTIFILISWSALSSNNDKTAFSMVNYQRWWLNFCNAPSKPFSFVFIDFKRHKSW